MSRPTLWLIAITCLFASVDGAPTHDQVGDVNADELVAETGRDGGEELTATSHVYMGHVRDSSKLESGSIERMYRLQGALKNELKQKVMQLAEKIKPAYVPWCGTIKCWMTEEVAFKKLAMEKKDKIMRVKELNIKSGRR